MPRTAALVALVLLALAAAGLFLYWPTVVSGRTYDLRVRSVVIHDGNLHVEFEDRLSYGTRCEWRFPGHGGVGAQTLVNIDTFALRAGGFLRWPRSDANGVYDVDLNPADRDLEGGPDPAAAAARVLLKPGAYRLREGETLIIFRAKTRTGEILEGDIEVKADVDEGFTSLPSPAPPRTSK